MVEDRSKSYASAYRGDSLCFTFSTLNLDVSIKFVIGGTVSKWRSAITNRVAFSTTARHVTEAILP
jgi:hypothetical protein